MKLIDCYCVTLREGLQTVELAISVDDMIAMTIKLDELGVAYIEGGWLGTNPKANEYFKRVKSLKLKHAKITAFSQIADPRTKAEESPYLLNLLEADTEVVTVFGKTNEAEFDCLSYSPEENLISIYESISFLRKHGKRVFFDAEHFFDGYKYNREYALACLAAAARAGAETIILCDTNGGSLPLEVYSTVKEVVELMDVPIGVHIHNDSECAVANTIMAVQAGASHVQCAINGIGERCGNANLSSVISNLQLKLGYTLIPWENLVKLTSTSRFIDERCNQTPNKRQPFVGKYAFAHKGGIHLRSVKRRPSTYEHIDPDKVGNTRLFIGSDQGGITGILRKADEFGISLPNSKDAEAIKKQIQGMEDFGYEYASAEASLDLLIRRMTGQLPEFFILEEFRVMVEKSAGRKAQNEATTLFKIGNEEEHTVFKGECGPVHAIDQAMRKALQKFYPSLRELELTDYKVRKVNGGTGTAQKIHVLCDFSDGQKSWSTVDVDENIIIASKEALIEAYIYKLIKDGIEPMSLQLTS